jgi:hypothetical protein
VPANSPPSSVAGARNYEVRIALLGHSKGGIILDKKDKYSRIIKNKL